MPQTKTKPVSWLKYNSYVVGSYHRPALEAAVRWGKDILEVKLWIQTRNGMDYELYMVDNDNVVDMAKLQGFVRGYMSLYMELN